MYSCVVEFRRLKFKLDNMKIAISFLYFFSFTLVITFNSCAEKPQIKNQVDGLSEKEREAIIQQYVYDCADTYNYNYPEYHLCLDSGIALDSTIAYLWQQKAMPYFKQMKYSIGMKYLDKAVMYDEKRWLSYRGFIKCIFQKDYEGAILDFEKCVNEYGNSFEMDHTYNFYIAVSLLQLNRFEKAEQMLKMELDSAVNLFGPGSEHHLDLFYYGISKYEQQKWKEAISVFDRALSIYPQFSDVEHYKGLSMYRIGNRVEGAKFLKQSKEHKKLGYTINEDNSAYERYPYQLY
jgi:tetratricopeptide (TPR) repeat protein